MTRALAVAADRGPGWPVPWIAGGLFAVQGAVLGTLTGGSANPARQLGPALFAGEFHLLGVYLLAPVAGGVLAGCLVRSGRTWSKRFDHAGAACAASSSRS